MEGSKSLPSIRNPAPGRPTRGVGAADVDRVADALLRQGERPTVEKVRGALGTGSPNTINPLLDAWWKRLSSRLDAGPAALHRLPESVAHVAEALWMQALDEARRRAMLEQARTQRAALELQSSLEVRSHVLSLREGELDSRLKERERAIQGLEDRLREVLILLRKEQASGEAAQARASQLAQDLARLRVRVAPASWRPPSPVKPKRSRKAQESRGRRSPALTRTRKGRAPPKSKKKR